MEAYEASRQIVAGETRMDFGWGLAKYAWRLSRRRPLLLGLALPAAAFLSAAGALELALVAPDRDGPALGFLALILCCVLAGVFFQTALTFAADAAIDGQPIGWRDALADARWRFGAVAAWALIVTAAGLLILVLGGVDRLGLVVSIVGCLWSFLTVLVVPVLALDVAGPGEALREARELLRDRWGEQLAGLFAIGAIAVLASIPIGILIGVGASHNRAEAGSGTLAIVVGMVLGVVLWTLFFATFQAFAVGLYRDATGGLPGGGAFVARRPKRKSWIVRIAAIVLIGLVTLGLVFSIAGPRPAPKEFRTGLPASYATAITAGMPVVYRGIEVGEVRRSEISGSEDVIWFTVDPAYRSLQSSSSITVGFFEGRPCLEIVLPGQAPTGPPASAGPA